MRCNDARELIEELIDGELATDDAAAVRGHVDSCDECRPVYERHLAVASKLRALPRMKAPDGLAESITARIAAEASSARTTGQGKVIRASAPGMPWWVTRALPAAAAVMLAVLVGLQVQTGRSSRTLGNSADGVASDVEPSARHAARTTRQPQDEIKKQLNADAWEADDEGLAEKAPHSPAETPPIAAEASTGGMEMDDSAPDADMAASIQGAPTRRKAGADRPTAAVMDMAKAKKSAKAPGDRGPARIGGGKIVRSAERNLQANQIDAREEAAKGGPTPQADAARSAPGLGGATALQQKQAPAAKMRSGRNREAKPGMAGGGRGAAPPAPRPATTIRRADAEATYGALKDADAKADALEKKRSPLKPSAISLRAPTEDAAMRTVDSLARRFGGSAHWSASPGRARVLVASVPADRAKAFADALRSRPTPATEATMRDRDGAGDEADIALAGDKVEGESVERLHKAETEGRSGAGERQRATVAPAGPVAALATADSRAEADFVTVRIEIVIEQ